MGERHLRACRLRPAPGSRLTVPSAPPGLEEGPRLTPGSDSLSLPAQHKPAWSFDRGVCVSVCLCVCVCVCVCLCVCVKGGTQAHPSPILSLLDPGDLKWRVAQKGNPGPGLLRRGNPGSRVVGTSWSLQEKLGGSGRAEGRPPVSFLQLFVKCSPSQNLLGHSTCSTEYASTPPHPGFSTLHSCQPCLPASLWDAIHLGICSSPPNHPHPPT